MIRRLRLIPKFMTSQTGAGILPNISTRLRQSSNEIWSVNITEMFFFKNHAENEEGRLVPDLFVFSKKLI